MQADDRKMNAGMTRRTLLGSISAAGLFPSFATATTAAASHAAVPALEIGLRIGQPQSGLAGWRHAAIHGGSVAGALMQGRVQSGRLEWLVDPASGAVAVVARVQMRRDDGVLVELCDRTTHAGADGSDFPGLTTAPQLLDAAGASLPHPVLAGRLDASGFARGVVTLRAFEQR